MNRTCLVIDIETIPLPFDIISKLAPEFEAPSNYTDPVKIAAAIDKKRLAWLDDAALDPMTASVVVAGLAQVNLETNSIEKQWAYCEDMEPGFGESQLIRAVTSDLLDTTCVTGYNITGFDLPFLLRRALLLGLTIPRFRNRFHGRWSWSDNIQDLVELWQSGERGLPPKLDTLAKAFGLPPKLGSGKDFPQMWKDDRNKALTYNARDVEIESMLAMRML